MSDENVNLDDYELSDNAKLGIKAMAGTFVGTIILTVCYFWWWEIAKFFLAGVFVMGAALGALFLRNPTRLHLMAQAVLIHTNDLQAALEAVKESK